MRKKLMLAGLLALLVIRGNAQAGPMQVLQQSQDANYGEVIGSIQGPGYINVYYPSASGTSVTVPTGANVAFFSFDADVCANFNGGTAAYPPVAKTDGSGCDMNPAVRDVTGLTSFSVACSNCKGSIRFVKTK